MCEINSIKGPIHHGGKRTLVFWTVGNKFSTAHGDSNIKKIRKLGYVEYGKYNSLIDAWKCMKNHPDACISRCIFDGEDLMFEHYYGRETQPLCFKGKFLPKEPFLISDQNRLKRRWVSKLGPIWRNLNEKLQEAASLGISPKVSLRECPLTGVTQVDIEFFPKQPGEEAGQTSLASNSMN